MSTPPDPRLLDESQWVARIELSQSTRPAIARRSMAMLRMDRAARIAERDRLVRALRDLTNLVERRLGGECVEARDILRELSP